MPLWYGRRALTGLKIISRKPALAPISEATAGPMVTFCVMETEAKRLTPAKGQVGTRWVVRLVDGAVEVGASHPNAVTLVGKGAWRVSGLRRGARPWSDKAETWFGLSSISGRRAQAELLSYAHPCAANEYRTECIQVRRFGAGIDSCHGVVAHRTNKPLAVAVLAELEPRHAVAVPAGSNDLLDALTAGSVEAPSTQHVVDARKAIIADYDAFVARLVPEDGDQAAGQMVERRVVHHPRSARAAEVAARSGWLSRANND